MPTIPNPPQLGISLPALPHTGAGVVVSNGWATAQGYASNAVTSANSFLTGLSTAANSIAAIPVISDALAANSKAIGAYVAPAALSRPASLATIDDAFSAAAPTSPTLATITLPTAPADVALPNAPAIRLASTPTAPVLSALSTPTAPVLSALSVPAAPTLASINVPTAVLLSVPSFDAVAPGSPAAMSRTFSFLESSYTSGLLTSLKALLQSWVDGAATGIKTSVEQATWDRARARETTNAAQKALEAVRGFAMRGFAKPPGMLAIEMARAQQEAQNANSALSRDIAIKQADLEQSNRRFALEQSFKVESELITYSNLLAQRAFEAERYAQSAAIEIYQQYVAKYSADIQLYSQRVEQWKAATQAELVKLEKYKADLEGQRLLTTVNETTQRIYATQVDAATRGHTTLADNTQRIHATQVDAATRGHTTLADNTQRIHATQVDAATRVFTALVDEDVRLYASEIEKVTKSIELFRAKVDVANVSAQVNKSRIEAYAAEVNAYGERFRARAAQYGTIADVYSKDVQAFTARSSAEVGRMGAEAEAYTAEATYLGTAASVRIETAKANIANLTQKMGLLIESAKGGAQVGAQMAASALSSVHMSASISSADTASASTNVSASSSQNLGVNYGYAASDSSATNTTTNRTG